VSGSAFATVLFSENRDARAIGSLDPRARLIICLSFLFALPLLDRPVALAAALLFGIAAVLFARLPARMIIGRLLIAEGFLLVLLLTLPFVVPGRPIVSILGLVASWEGLARALTLVVRINAGVLVTLALLGGLGSIGLARAMTGIGLPERLAQLLEMTVRYIALFAGEYRRLRRAMLVRGFHATSSRHSWRSLGNFLGMLLVRSLERAERVHWAMVCRGFSGKFLAAEPQRLTRTDAWFLAGSTGAIVALQLLEAWT
jgi:cobalt/nickel transport system permease protein